MDITTLKTIPATLMPLQYRYRLNLFNMGNELIDQIDCNDYAYDHIGPVPYILVYDFNTNPPTKSYNLIKDIPPNENQVRYRINLQHIYKIEILPIESQDT